jgi:DNA processing protein
MPGAGPGLYDKKRKHEKRHASGASAPLRSADQHFAPALFPGAKREHKMTKLYSADAFDALVTLEKRSFARATRDAVSRLLEETLPANAKLAVKGGEDYPSEIAAIPESPDVLVYRGDLSLVSRQLKVAVVGSRDATPEAIAAAKRISEGLASRGALVVTALSDGVSSSALEGALASGRKGTCAAVLGTPLSFEWPRGGGRLTERVASQGLLISLSPQISGLSFTQQERHESLERRGRLIAALATGSLVFAARDGSNALSEVHASLALERPVLIWKGCEGEGDWADGLLKDAPLDREGNPLVSEVETADDVERALSPWNNVWWL